MVRLREDFSAEALRGRCQVTEVCRHAAGPSSLEGDLRRESAPLGQSTERLCFVDLSRDEMALLIELVVHLGMN
jgi:hypothetical protein